MTRFWHKLQGPDPKISKGGKASWRLLLALLLLAAPFPACAGTTVFNCSSFSSSGACAAVQAGYGNQSFIVRNGGYLSGNQIDFVPANSGHNGYGLSYYTPVDVTAFSTTFSFIPNGQNIAFVVQNTTDQPGYQGNLFSSGAGCESGFYQAFVQPPALVSPNNIFALEFDSSSWLTEASAAFTYSSVQIYQQNQSPCLPNDNGPNYVATNKISTSPVPLNSPPNAQNTTTGHVYSATVNYDGTNLTLSMYDQTAGGACPGAACFTQTWPVDIPSLVAGSTAYVGFTSGVNIANLPALYVNSWSYSEGPPAQAAAPTFSPGPGTYQGSQNVTMATTSPGASICYNTSGSPATNGSNSCSNGSIYTGPVTVSSTESLYAVAGGTGYGDSTVSSGSYVIQPAVAAPTFSPAGGTYSGSQSVSINDATANATVYYTTNGTAPTTSSTKYTGPISVSATETLEAIATASGSANSEVAASLYTITSLVPTATPTFSPAAGTYGANQSVTITDATSGATLYYTTDGSTPGTSSTQYAGPVVVDTTETLKAIAVGAGLASSAVGSASYTIDANSPVAAIPEFSPAPTVYSTAQSVTISDATSGATVYYTTNGSPPTTSSAEYTGPISVSATETLEAIAVVPGESNSPAAIATYTIQSSLAAAATPAFSPAPGAFMAAQTVSISDSTPGAVVYYTTNGNVPTTASTLYAGPVAVNATATVEAIAVAPGYSSSAIASGAYTISSSLPSIATPTFDPAAGTYPAAQNVSIADATSGATIYYTTDGSIPTASSNVYSGPIAVHQTETIQAIAAASGDSAVASASYTITAQPKFTLATSVNSLTINSGGQGTVQITVTPQDGFNSPVVLACSGLPTWATCSFGASVVTPAGSAATTQLTISASSQSSDASHRSPGMLPFVTMALSLGCWGLRKRSGWRSFLLMMVGAGSLGLLFGCSANSASTNAQSTSALKSTVTVTAISSGLQGSAAIAVTVN